MDLDNEEFEATKSLKEKTADEMFKDNHYIKRENENIIIYVGKEILIEFYLLTKNIEITNIINIQELQAINKKCKELGWIE